MRLLATLSLAASLVSAIDIILYTENDCRGISYVYGSVNPNSCRGTNSNGFRSVKWEYIPTDWNIETRAYSGGQCANRYYTGYSERRRTAICAGNRATSGAGYGFASRKKRLVSDSTEEVCSAENETNAAEENCIKQDKPDFLQLEDGTRYRVVDMNSETFKQLCYDSEDWGEQH